MMRRGLFDLFTIVGFFSLVSFGSPGCNSEVLEKQAEQIKQQEAQIAAQNQEIEALRAGQKKQQECNRAFRDYFEKAQALADRDKAIALYRELGFEEIPSYRDLGVPGAMFMRVELSRMHQSKLS